MNNNNQNNRNIIRLLRILNNNSDRITILLNNNIIVNIDRKIVQALLLLKIITKTFDQTAYHRDHCPRCIIHTVFYILHRRLHWINYN